MHESLIEGPLFGFWIGVEAVVVVGEKEVVTVGFAALKFILVVFESSKSNIREANWRENADLSWKKIEM